MPRSLHTASGQIVFTEHARRRASERCVPPPLLEALARMMSRMGKALGTAARWTTTWKGIAAVFAREPSGRITLITCWNV